MSSSSTKSKEPNQNNYEHMYTFVLFTVHSGKEKATFGQKPTGESTLKKVWGTYFVSVANSSHAEGLGVITSCYLKGAI